MVDPPANEGGPEDNRTGQRGAEQGISRRGLLTSGAAVAATGLRLTRSSVRPLPRRRRRDVPTSCSSSADNVGWGDFSCYGGSARRLGSTSSRAKGIRFNNYTDRIAAHPDAHRDHHRPTVGAVRHLPPLFRDRAS